MTRTAPQCAIAQAAGLYPSEQVRTGDVIDRLSTMPLPELREALATGVVKPDLRDLCDRLGYATSGTKVELVDRILDAMEADEAEVRGRGRCAYVRGLVFSLPPG